VIGGWSSTARDEIADLLFDDDGLGLNIARYNIGGGVNPDPNKDMRVGAEVPTFEPTNSTWDWTADANQRWVLTEALARDVNIVEGFVNSPPAWMLSEACTAGGIDGVSNLPSSNNAVFADYVAEVTEHFADNWDTAFRTVSLFNEPSSGWWQCGNNQEGNHVDRSQQATLIQAAASELSARGLPTGVVGGEEYAVSDSVTSWNSYASSAKDAATQINTHTYDAGGGAALRVAGRTEGKRLWVSEVGIGGTEDHDHNDLSSAMQLAERIIGDLTSIRPDGWVYWQAVEDEAGDNNYGFIHANFTGSESYWVTKQYYAMANFSRFIRPGSIIVQVNDNKSLAAVNPETGQLTLVSYNDGSSSRDVAFDLASFGTVSGNAARYETSASNSAAQLSPVPVSDDNLALSLPAQSVTTLVLNGVELPDAGANLLTNPGFEAGSSLTGWTAEWNPSLAGVETGYPDSGSRNGYLHPSTNADVALAQTITASDSGTYTFSAYAATDIIEGVQLGIDVDGDRMDSRPVVADVGYQRYDLTATVEAGQTVKVWYYASQRANGWATLDTTSLTVQPTLLSNAGFESGSLTGWTVEWNSARGMVESNYPFTGSYDGALNPTSSQDVALAQTVTAPSTKTYTLTAKVAASGNNVSLGVDVAGSQAASLTVVSGGAYQTRTLTFSATQGQSIKVWYYSPASSGWATIDDVNLS
jgi:O-glycosyl hydrolase